MPRSSLFLKVEIEYDKEESPERLGEELCRLLMKQYAVNSAEVSSVARHEE